jgi:threonine dehydrogenase-like Zn-dependent dehydrogenase
MFHITRFPSRQVSYIVSPMADMVRAVVQTGARQMELREFPRPVISGGGPGGGADGALLRVEACGICGSDVEQYKGSMGTRGLPMIPGHEPLGIIEEITPETAARWGVSAGDRVAVEILIPCRSCDLCLAGQYMQCKNRAGSHGGYNPPERGLGLYGGYAEYMHLHPNSIVHRMDPSLPAEIAVMYNPLGAGVRWALQYGGVHLGSTVAVLGAGQRGLAAILAAKYVGAGLIIATGLARDARKLELAKEFGADHVINVEEEDTVARIRELTGGDGVDLVCEMSGHPSGHAQAFAAARLGGRVNLLGTPSRTTEVDFARDVIFKGLTLYGVTGRKMYQTWDEMRRFLRAGQLDPRPVITHRFPLESIAEAIQVIKDGQAGKVILEVAA